jgi:hypothetical protein
MSNQALETLLGEFTLNDLAERTGKTVEQIVAFAMNDEPTKASKPKPKLVAIDTESVNTRTPEGREAYDEAILVFLKARKGHWMRAGEIREACGGTALQARTALARLIEEEKITYQGRARATEYKA